MHEWIGWFTGRHGQIEMFGKPGNVHGRIHVRTLDHVIVVGGCTMSFAERGLI